MTLDENYQNRSIETLLDNYVALQDTLDFVNRSIRAIQHELLERMKMSGARELGHHHPTHMVKLDAGSPTYRHDVLDSIKELLSTEDYTKAFTPAHTETKTIEHEAKWSGQQLNRIERAYGGAVAETIREARVYGDPRLKIVEKKS